MSRPNIEQRGNVVYVELMYPNCDERVDTVEVDLSDVRATDSVRVTFDYERNGWSILQASVFEWEADDTEYDADWQEVAFVPAWGRDRSRHQAEPEPHEEPRGDPFFILKPETGELTTAFLERNVEAFQRWLRERVR